MSTIEKIQNLHWKWDGKLEPLAKMNNQKLEFIRNFVMTRRGFYGTIYSEDWADSIKYLIDYRNTKKKFHVTIEKVTKLVENKLK